MELEKYNKKLARKLIKEHFRFDGNMISFCPYLVWSDKASAYFDKELWIAICKEFIKKIGAS